MRLGRPGSTVTVRGKTARGTWSQTLRVPEGAPYETAAAVRARFARDRVEDHELHLAAGGYAAEIDREIEALGVAFQIATRLTSWVAISHEITVDRGAKPRRETQPQEMVHGLSIEGLGLRAANATSATLTDSVSAPMSLRAASGEFFTPSQEEFDDRVVTGAGMVIPQGAPSPASVPSASYAEPRAMGASYASMAPSQAPMSPSPGYMPSASPSASFDPSTSLPQRSKKRSLPRWILALYALILALVAGWFVYRATRAPEAPASRTPTTRAVTSPPRTR